MELLLALDFITIPDAKKILHEVGDIIDIVEVGTPFIVQEGVHAVREIRKEFPHLKIFADLKIMDAGEHETETAIEAGADIISVLGVASNVTIKASADAAHKRGKHLLVDMIDVPDLAARAQEVDTLGVDYICVHTAFDVQASGKNPLEELHIISAVVKNAKLAAAGGVKLNTLPLFIELNPAIIVVGGGITGEADKREAAKKIKACINQKG